MRKMQLIVALLVEMTGSDGSSTANNSNVK